MYEKIYTHKLCVTIMIGSPNNYWDMWFYKLPFALQEQVAMSQTDYSVAWLPA